MKSALEQIRPFFADLADEIQQVPDQDGKVSRGLGSSRSRVAKAIEEISFRALPPLLEGRLVTTGISLDSNIYSSSNPHNTKGHAYNTFVVRGFRKLEDAGYIYVHKKGYLNRDTGKSGNTQYRLTAKMRGWLQSKLKAVGFTGDFSTLIVDPLLVPNGPALRAQKKSKLENKGGIQRTVPIKFEDTERSRDFEQEVGRVNALLKRTWIDLDCDQDQWLALGAKLKMHKDKDKPKFIRYCDRSLCRVFNDSDLTTGGRYYGGWWETMPKEFRKHIVVDGKATVEIDYSGLHPAMLYAIKGSALPSDPYSPILGKKHRDLSKRIFNALVNAKKEMKGPPRNMRIIHTGYRWKQIKQRVFEVHSDIADFFCTGAGLQLMYEDSQLAEGVMKHFANMGVPCLPVHDSFIVHHGYEEELLTVMTDLFYQRFGVRPRTDTREPIFVTSKIGGKEDGFGNADVDAVLAANDTPQDRRLDAFRSLL